MNAKLCQKCSTIIFFGQNVASGKWVPLDATPVDPASIELKGRPGNALFKWGVYRRLTDALIRKVNRLADEPAGAPFALYRSHFETCTDPGKFSRKTRRRPQ